MVAPCLLGLEGLVADELKFMEAENVSAQNGRVFFEGDENILCRANINSRYAERIPPPSAASSEPAAIAEGSEINPLTSSSKFMYVRNVRALSSPFMNINVTISRPMFRTRLSISDIPKVTLKAEPK